MKRSFFAALSTLGLIINVAVAHAEDIILSGETCMTDASSLTDNENQIRRAIINSDLEAVKRLVTADNVNMQTVAQVSRGNSREISRNGMNVWVVDYDMVCVNLLHFALREARNVVGRESDRVEIIGYLIELGIDVKARDSRGTHPLSLLGLYQGEKERDTALHAALIKNGAHVSEYDLDRYLKYNFDLAVLAIENGAKPENIEEFLERAANESPASFLKLLLSKGFQPNRNTLIGAARSKTDALEKVKILLDAKLPIDVPKDPNDKSLRMCGVTTLSTPLIAAISGGNTDVFHYLLAQGADVNADCPAAVASRYSELDYLKTLIARGASINPTNCPCDVTPLSEALSLPVVQYLVQNGADIHSEAVRRSFRQSIEYRRNDVVNYLVSVGLTLPPDAINLAFLEPLITCAHRSMPIASAATDEDILWLKEKGAKSIKFVVPKIIDDKWIEDVLMATLVKRLEQLNLRKEWDWSEKSILYVEFHVNDYLYIIKPWDAVEVASEYLGLSPEEMFKRWGSGKKNKK